MKVAIVHYWLVGMRGGERVLEQLLDIFPQAEIFTHVYDPGAVSEQIRSHKVHQTFIGRLPGAKQHYQKYLPLMPRALEQLDLQKFDLIISSESGPAKGIIPRPDAVHLCYCHSPMRYLWDQYWVYRAGAGRLARMTMPHLSHRLRIWDVTSAARVDHFIANSSFVAERIERYYRREAEVIPPPVAVDDFAISPAPTQEYLMAGELVSYKRPELAIEAFNASGLKLTVVGDGPMRSVLESAAGPNITFKGRVPFDALRREFAAAKALIFPGEEDFGIVPVEVMASGRPVIAFGRGGALDYVIPGKTGIFFHEQTTEALSRAVDEFEAHPELANTPTKIRESTMRFHQDRFKAQIRARVETLLGARAH